MLSLDINHAARTLVNPKVLDIPKRRRNLKVQIVPREACADSLTQ